MWNIPSKETLANIPKLYATESIPLKDKLIYLHFFIGGCDWYVAEFDGEDLFFGYADLNDQRYAEWGYFGLSDLLDVKIDSWLEVDCEINWKIKKASEIDHIKT